MTAAVVEPVDDELWSAIGDPTRRRMLDLLLLDGVGTATILGQQLPVTRQAVAKHLGILEAANLVSVVRRGREKLHYLNPVPIGEIVRRWVGKFEDARLDALTDFKEQIETNQEKRRA